MLSEMGRVMGDEGMLPEERIEVCGRKVECVLGSLGLYGIED